jgi:hypothetical protein
MKTIEFLAVPPDIMINLEEALAKRMRGERDPGSMRLASERLDRTREQIFQRVGLLDFAVPTIRALRDGDE